MPMPPLHLSKERQQPRGISVPVVPEVRPPTIRTKRTSPDAVFSAPGPRSHPSRTSAWAMRTYWMSVRGCGSWRLTSAS